MYAIVHKNRVVIGPMEWKRKYFTQVLKQRHKVTASLPDSAPKQFPFVIDQNTSVYQVVTNMPNYDAMIEWIRGPIWDISNNPIVANYDVFDLDIEVARNHFKAVAAAERYKKETAGTTAVLNGVEIALSTERGSKEPLIQKLLSMSDSDVCKWKFGLTWMDLTRADLQTLIKAIDSHVQTAFDWEAEIHSQLDAITVLADLHSVEILPKPEFEQDLPLLP